MRIVGIDLAAEPKNPTGLAILSNRIAETMLLEGDDEILAATVKAKPSVVAIDAPLSLPKAGISREADRALVKKGFRCFWPLLPSMRLLTLRGIRLKEILENHGLHVIEVFPSATQKLLGIPTKREGKANLLQGLRDIGVSIITESPSHHELDSVTAALTGSFYLSGRYEAVGDQEEGQVILPANAQSEGLHR